MTTATAAVGEQVRAERSSSFLLACAGEWGAVASVPLLQQGVQEAQ